MIKVLPDIVSYGLQRQIEKSSELRKTIEVLLLRARGDNTDAIRLQASESIREIASHLGSEKIIEDVIPRLT